MFETLLFDMDQGSISLYLDEVNMHHKIRLRDDSRIDFVLYFEEHLTLVAHLKKKNSKKDDVSRESFMKIKTLQEFEQTFSASEDFLVLKIFDKVRVKVDTTKEFPLDIECTLMFTKEDHEEYEKLIALQ